MKKPKITVHKDGAIIGINRHTQVPFAALELSEQNMMSPKETKRKVFVCKEDK